MEINVFSLEEKQMELLRETLLLVKLLGRDSLESAKKKEEAAKILSQALDLEKEISSQAQMLEKISRDYLELAKNEENSAILRASLPFLNKYDVEEWLLKLQKYLEEGNHSLVIRTIEEELLDPHFGIMAGRAEHTKNIEQKLPEEERDVLGVYRNSLETLKATAERFYAFTEASHLRSEVDKEKVQEEWQALWLNFSGKGWLWKKGLVPDIEKFAAADYKEKKEVLSTLSPVEVQERSTTLLKVSDALTRLSQLAIALLEANLSLTLEQRQIRQEELLEALQHFSARTFNLLIPPVQRQEVKSTLPSAFAVIPKAAPAERKSSNIPEFVFEYFQYMENLARETQKCAEEGDFRGAVQRLEEIYRQTMHRDWERLKRYREDKLYALLLERNGEARELVQEVRSVVRVGGERERCFSQLILTLEQTNQLLAAQK